MNKIYKVVKGKVCSEFARCAGKGLVSATILALSSFTVNAQAANVIDPAYANQAVVLAGENNSVGGTLPASMTTSTSITTIAGSGNQLISSNSSQITGNGNVLVNSDAPVVGESNRLTGVYGTVVGDVNNIITTAKPTSTEDDRKPVFVYGNGNNVTDISSGTIVGQQNKITADTSTTSPISYGSGANVIGFNSGRVFGDNNTLTNVAGSSIVGQDNKLKDADMTVLGDGNTATHQYGYISGDNNTTTQYDPNDIASTQHTAIYGGGNKVIGTTNGEMINVSGTNNTLTDNKQVQVIGSNNASKSVTYSNIIGSSNTVTSVQGANVLGSGATVTAQNSVTLGNGSTNNRDNTVSIGTAGAERQITNVKAGSESTDAVNVSQLTTAITDAGTQAKSYADAQNQAQTQALNTATTNLQTNMDGLQNQINTKADQATLVSWNQDRMNEISALQTQVDKNTADIATTNQNLATTATNLQNNINAVDTKVNANTQAIADTNAKVATNTADIATNKQAIADNKATADAQNVATNARIDTTNAQVAANTQAIADTNNRLTKEVSRIDGVNATQDTAIASLQAGQAAQQVALDTKADKTYVDAQDATLQAQIDSNKAVADANNTATLGRIDNLTTVVADNAAASQARDDALQGQIDTTNTNLNNQVSRLDRVNATQDAAIATKAEQSALNATNAQVATNTQAIADNKATADAQNVATNTRIDNVVAKNTADLAGVNARIDTTNTQVAANTQAIANTQATVAQNQAANDAKNAQQDQAIADTAKASQARDDALQAQVTDNKATADSQNVATNQRIDATNSQVATNTKAIADTQTTVADNKAVQDAKNAQLDATDSSLQTQITNNQTTVNNRFETFATTVNQSTGALDAKLAKTIENQAAVDAAQDAYINKNASNISALGYRMDNINKDLSGGIAGATALAMMPTASEPAARMVSFGSGFYNGESAVSVGYTGTSENGKWAFKTGMSFNTASDATFGAGVGFRWK